MSACLQRLCFQPASSAQRFYFPLYGCREKRGYNDAVVQWRGRKNVSRGGVELNKLKQYLILHGDEYPMCINWEKWGSCEVKILHISPSHQVLSIIVPKLWESAWSPCSHGHREAPPSHNTDCQLIHLYCGGECRHNHTGSTCCGWWHIPLFVDFQTRSSDTERVV